METEKIKKDTTIDKLLKIVSDYNSEYILRRIKGEVVGGSIIDLLEGRVPKDYDIIITDKEFEFENLLLKNEAVFAYETATSKTYNFNSKMIQILKTNKEDFDFTMSKSNIDFRGDIQIEEECFKNKRLIPTSFSNKKHILNSLSRIPHWKNKGYTIEDVTYLSLINQLNTKESTNMLPYIS